MTLPKKKHSPTTMVLCLQKKTAAHIKPPTGVFKLLLVNGYNQGAVAPVIVIRASWLRIPICLVSKGHRKRITHIFFFFLRGGGGWKVASSKIRDMPISTGYILLAQLLGSIAKRSRGSPTSMHSEASEPRGAGGTGLGSESGGATR